MKSVSSLLITLWFLWSFLTPLRVWGATEPTTEAVDPKSISAAEVCEAVQVDGHALLLLAYAYGVQIYQCQANPVQFEWVFQAPEADLFNEEALGIGRHFAGPTWQLNDPDGSLVRGTAVANCPSPDPEAIPWLKLQAREGTGRLRDVKFIQRLFTNGGRAPAEGCDASHDGEMVRVDYSANYYFWVLPE